MDTLRASLEIIFNEMKVKPLLMTAQGTTPSTFDSNRFRRLCQQKESEYSNDQCNLVTEMVTHFYLHPKETHNGLTFCPEESVFNALLHFSDEVLTVDKDSGDPICVFKNLLRWDSLTTKLGEDFLTTSFLASKEISKPGRTSFDWGLIIGQDNSMLNEGVFSNKMADIHMHLKGSSSNFDLNWLSLMISPQKRANSFKELNNLLNPIPILSEEDNDRWSLHTLTLKACAIRFYLYIRYVKQEQLGEYDSELIESILRANSSIMIRVSDLDSLIRAEMSSFNLNSVFLNCDYAYQVDKEAIKKNPNVIISGERRLLYHCFRACYSGKLSKTDCVRFYAYILIKNQIRRELVQSNGYLGFGNFNAYEKRKTLFIENNSIFNKLIEPLALGQCFYKRPQLRYAEPRITPKGTYCEMKVSVERIEKGREYYTNIKKEDIHYVLHFIKTKEEPLQGGGYIYNPRHNYLRKQVYQQALAINEFRQNSSFHKRIVGIDAANSEIFARPEVFAQAFRFLHGHCVNRSDKEQVYSLGMTYHVGEDFLSPIDGLRAIDEVLRYMRFGKNNRLGHALVLGLDAKMYLKSRHNTLLLPKLMILDNIAWCFHEVKMRIGFYSMYFFYKELFNRVFEEVYEEVPVSLSDYYDSWLLRGDNPTRYQEYLSKGINESVSVSDWGRFDFNDDPDVVKARNNPTACRLYYRYHFDYKVRKNGDEIIDLICVDGTEKIISSLQRFILRKLKHNNIRIETNPTSNLKIGGFKSYRNLPIFEFTPLNRFHHRPDSSVNTDDRGIFTTSLEREFALLACALYKGSHDYGPSYKPVHNMRKICRWLNRLRNNAIKHRFVNYI